MEIVGKRPEGIEENCRHNDLLARATAQIDQLVSGASARQYMGELLDWMAYFTREHFGFQERLMAECAKQRDYLAGRAAVHGEFRRKLARLCIDSTRGDPTVPERLRALCHEILDDAQAQHAALPDLLEEGGAAMRLRADRRRRPLAEDAAEALVARLPGRAPH